MWVPDGALRLASDAVAAIQQTVDVRGVGPRRVRSAKHHNVGLRGRTNLSAASDASFPARLATLEAPANPMVSHQREPDDRAMNGGARMDGM
jgi:hypothetical protein